MIKYENIGNGHSQNRKKRRVMIGLHHASAFETPLLHSHNQIGSQRVMTVLLAKTKHSFLLWLPHSPNQVGRQEVRIAVLKVLKFHSCLPYGHSREQGSYDISGKKSSLFYFSPALTWSANRRVGADKFLIPKVLFLFTCPP